MMDEQLKQLLAQMLFAPASPSKMVYNLAGYHCCLSVTEMNEWEFYVKELTEYKRWRHLEDQIFYELEAADTWQGNRVVYLGLCSESQELYRKLGQIAEDWYKNILNKPEHT